MLKSIDKSLQKVIEDRCLEIQQSLLSNMDLENINKEQLKIQEDLIKRYGYEANDMFEEYMNLELKRVVLVEIEIYLQGIRDGLGLQKIFHKGY